MKILALEMSTQLRTVAAIDDGRLVGSVQEDSGKSGTPYRWITQTLEKANWSRADVEGILVGLGPGSYTGIRIALSIATGWRLGHQISVMGAPTLDLIALQAWSEGMKGRFGIGIDVGRKEWYGAYCRIDESGYAFETAVSRKSSSEWMHADSDDSIWLGPMPPDKASDPARFQTLTPGPESLAEWIRLQRQSTSNSDSSSILDPIYARPVEFVKAPAVDLSFLEVEGDADPKDDLN